MAPPNELPNAAPVLAVDVVERDSSATPRKGRLLCRIGREIEFKLDDLESYCLADWRPEAYDAMIVAAAIEFVDRTKRRPSLTWRRKFALRIPVHDPALWNSPAVSGSLHDLLGFLTGDDWEVEFRARRKPFDTPHQWHFRMDGGSAAVIPFSDGLDSCAVAGLMARELGDGLIRVRLGKKAFLSSGSRQPFTSVPYKVRGYSGGAFVESSARSRGFKFALISGLAAYLAKANRIIVPESGQGALGPVLATVGQAYEDYRSHPLFTRRMQEFLFALLGHRVRFDYPTLWHTKAETLRLFVEKCTDSASWSRTRSCWQQNRQVSVNHRARQCGVCAACMLRRLSVHAAGLSETPETYVWEDLAASAFPLGAAAGFGKRKITGKLRQYAIAGVLHLDHLAGLRSSPSNARTLELAAFQLGGALDLPVAQTATKLDRLLAQHEMEWKGFLNSLGTSSFILNWAHVSL